MPPPTSARCIGRSSVPPLTSARSARVRNRRGPRNRHHGRWCLRGDRRRRLGNRVCLWRLDRVRCRRHLAVGHCRRDCQCWSCKLCGIRGLHQLVWQGCLAPDVPTGGCRLVTEEILESIWVSGIMGEAVPARIPTHDRFMWPVLALPFSDSIARVRPGPSHTAVSLPCPRPLVTLRRRIGTGGLSLAVPCATGQVGPTCGPGSKLSLSSPCGLAAGQNRNHLQVALPHILRGRRPSGAEAPSSERACTARYLSSADRGRSEHVGQCHGIFQSLRSACKAPPASP